MPKSRLMCLALAFIAALDRGRPLFSAAPVEVLDHLRASRPHLVHDRAWLVIYYSIVLSLVSSTDPTNASIKAKLRCNLWLALNDVRLLLEPSDLNIHALTLLACHVEEFTTPSLCWMLLTNACRMLQALGVTSRRFDSATRERRLMTFWHLNLADKGIALIFGRPPTFHRAMAKEIALPTVDQLLPFKPHVPSAAAGPVTFGAHYIHRLMLLSRLMAEIWSHLYDDVVPNESGVESATEELESWYQQTQTVSASQQEAGQMSIDMPHSSSRRQRWWRSPSSSPAVQPPSISASAWSPFSITT